MISWKITTPDPLSFELTSIKGLLARHFTLNDDRGSPTCNIEYVIRATPNFEVIVECEQTIGTDSNTSSVTKWTCKGYQEVVDLIDRNGWRKV